MDAREELEDLRTIVAEIRGVKAALSAVLSPEEPNTRVNSRMPSRPISNHRGARPSIA
jgi:predicted component of type VI protein secretion system